VAASIGEYRDALGLDLLSLSLDGPGLSREQVQEQMHLISSEVAPRLGVTMGAPS